MKKALLLSLSIIYYYIAHSQNVGIGTTSPTARLHVADSNVLFTGPATISLTTIYNPPIQGAGTRMMWYPEKAAFRVGNVDGAQWDKDNIGRVSFAAGFDAKAIGNVSTALGLGTTASGYSSTAIGYNTIASGRYSTTAGNITTASGEGATAMGGVTTASGNYSFAMGDHTTARSFGETVIGAYNSDYTPLSIDNWNAADRLFVIGNGTFGSPARDAMVVLKNGNVGVGTNTPTASLVISSSVNPQLLIRQTNSTDYARARLQTGNTRFWDIAAINEFEGVAYDRLNFFNSDAGNVLTIAGNGNVGIGNANPNAALQFSGSLSNRKIVFYEAANNDHQFNGFGLNPGVLRYQVNNSGDDHVFFAGTSANSSTELMRIKGNGNVGISNNNPNAPLSFAATLGKKISLYPGGTGDAGFGMAGNRLQIYADNPNADVAIGYDVAGSFNEKFAFKPDGSIAINGNTGTAGQVLTSNGNNSAATWQTPANAATILSDAKSPNSTGAVFTSGTLLVEIPTMQLSLTTPSGVNKRLLISGTVNVQTFGCSGAGCLPTVTLYLTIDGVFQNGAGVQITANTNSFQSIVLSNYPITVGAGTHTIKFAVAGGATTNTATVYPAFSSVMALSL